MNKVILFLFSNSEVFYFSSCLGRVARNFRLSRVTQTTLSSSRVGEVSLRVPDLRRSLMLGWCVFNSWVSLCWGISHRHQLVECFCHGSVQGSSKCFCHIDWDDYLCCFLLAVNVLYYLDWFSYVKTSFHSRNKPFYTEFDLQCFVKGFCTNVHKGYWSGILGIPLVGLLLLVFFLTVSLSGFDIRTISAS